MTAGDDLKQYLELYDTSRALLGNRAEARERLVASGGGLDAAFSPTDYGVNLQRLPLPVDVGKSFGCVVPAVSAVPAAVVNDIPSFPARLSERLPKGVTLMSLREAAEKGLIPEERIEGYDDAETRLNDLLWSDGVLLHVADGTVLEKPLQLVNIFSAPMNLMAIRRMIVVMGRNSEARILLCDHTHDPENRYLSAELITADLADDARLSFDIIEESSAQTTRRTTFNARLGSHAVLVCTAATLSCGDARIRFSVDVAGKGARAEVNGMVIADRNQKAVYDTQIVHRGENTSSNQLFKYVADGESHCSFNGRIIVREEARFTEAYQTNKNLLASEKATMHAEPTLLIYCDEVKCSHGAATGQLDRNALFYMRQRGIPLEQARQLLMESFVSDVIDTVHIAGLRDRLRHLAERRFSGLGSDVATCSDCSLNPTK